MGDLFYHLEPQSLMPLAKEKRAVYAAAEPFSHIVLDGVFPDEILEKVLAEFPTPDAIEWREFSEATQNKKLAAERDELLGPFTRHFLSLLNGAAFMEFLDEITGIDGLIPDPYFKGGGLHQTLPGGSLGVHADFNKYKRLGLDRRVNVLIYLNKDWKDEYGGHLELWNKDMTERVQKIAPIFNRMVIFSTTDTSYHGHPDPLTCPEGVSRKSLALYYYTAPECTGGERTAHSTLFRVRPGEAFTPKKGVCEFVKRCTPPIVMDAFRAIRTRH